MPENRKLAFKQLQSKLINLIKESEGHEDIIEGLEEIITDDFHFKLEYSKKIKLFLLKNEDED